MSITSVEEAYYLVRIGSWSQEDLEIWVCRRIADKVDEVTTQIYEESYEKDRFRKEHNHYGVNDYSKYLGKWY